MPVNRIILIFMVGGVFALFILSNLSSPVIALVFLGIEMPRLPLTVWIGGAIASGAVTSFVLQFLSYLQSGNQREWQFNRVSARSRGVRSEGFSSETPKASYSPPNQPNRTPNSASDWEESSDRDWNFDREAEGESQRSNYEANQQPASTSKSGSVYSYTYREKGKSEVGKTDGVYDANYRVIVPPYQKSPDSPQDDNDDEDWGFKDEEDFNRQPKP
ncbi:hypothetical protein [Limnofasciculus baicalensis]|uniref:LapA family protein n=1 Tax=Limnofasciculus baicalensis BBK-W-15 TaxID=2699891 RepID=A0AAE3GUY6_9CYAN|nr:hypothetical protein [Limnofasciculus baicalensis]MCP2730939.1 hypothetical protein [Limnofasciculus baicalensis BBK-W-15]